MIHSNNILLAIGTLIIGLIVGAALAFGNGSFGGHNGGKNAMHHDEHSHDHVEEMHEHGQQMIHDEISADDSAVMNMDTMMHNMNMSLEGKSGAEFDAMFLAQMITHHQGAVDMAQAALERASSTQLKAMATAIIEAQNTEIAQMEAWQVEWFGLPEAQ